MSMVATVRGSEPVATPARTREDADAGVRTCVHLMTSGQWVSGKSHEAVALEHGVSPATVKSWATNASRLIRLAVEGDREEIRARMLATLELIVSEAMTYRRVVVSRDGEAEAFPQPDLKAAISALETQAKLLGLISTKHDVTLRPAVAHLSREEHAAELAKLAAEIAAEQARIAEEA